MFLKICTVILWNPYMAMLSTVHLQHTVFACGLLKSVAMHLPLTTVSLLANMCQGVCVLSLHVSRCLCPELTCVKVFVSRAGPALFFVLNNCAGSYRANITTLTVSQTLLRLCAVLHCRFGWEVAPVPSYACLSPSVSCLSISVHAATYAQT